MPEDYDVEELSDAVDRGEDGDLGVEVCCVVRAVCVCVCVCVCAVSAFVNRYLYVCMCVRVCLCVRVGSCMWCVFVFV